MGRRRGRTWRRRISNREGVLTQRPVSQSHERIFIELLKWMKTNGFDSKNLRPAVFSGTGRGLMTLSSLQSGDDVISVPGKLIITSQTALSSYVGRSLEKYGRGFQQFSPLQILCLYLVYEKHRGARSFWSPYLSSLPDTFSTPAFFMHQQRQCLPDFLQEKATSQLNLIRSSYESAKELGSEIEASHRELSGGLSWEQYLWAWGVVNTRSIFMEQPSHHLLEGDDCLALVPLLDMLNHTGSAKVKAEFKKSQNCYTIQTLDTYKPYDQVFVSYGPHDNTKLFLEYGFVLPVNPHNSVAFREDDFYILKVLFSQNAWKAKLAMIKECDLLMSLCCSVDGPSWNLQCLLRILVRNWETRISCGEYLMTQPTEKEKCNMKKLYDVVLKKKLQIIQESLLRFGELGPCYHVTMVTTLLQQMEEIILKWNLKRVAFDTG